MQPPSADSATQVYRLKSNRMPGSSRWNDDDDDDDKDDAPNKFSDFNGRSNRWPKMVEISVRVTNWMIQTMEMLEMEIVFFFFFL